jgi:hypothetical protein
MPADRPLDNLDETLLPSFNPFATSHNIVLLSWRDPECYKIELFYKAGYDLQQEAAAATYKSTATKQGEDVHHHT